MFRDCVRHTWSIESYWWKNIIELIDNFSQPEKFWWNWLTDSKISRKTHYYYSTNKKYKFYVFWCFFRDKIAHFKCFFFNERQFIHKSNYIIYFHLLFVCACFAERRNSKQQRSRNKRANGLSTPLISFSSNQ